MPMLYTDMTSVVNDTPSSCGKNDCDVHALVVYSRQNEAKKFPVAIDRLSFYE